MTTTVLQQPVSPASPQSAPTEIRKKNAWWRRPKRTGPRPITIKDEDGRVTILKKMPQAWVWIDVEEAQVASNDEKFK